MRTGVWFSGRTFGQHAQALGLRYSVAKKKEQVGDRNKEGGRESRRRRRAVR